MVKSHGKGLKKRTKRLREKVTMDCMKQNNDNEDGIWLISNWRFEKKIDTSWILKGRDLSRAKYEKDSFKQLQNENIKF